MNINELLDGHQLPALPMRAWLSQREDATPGQSSSGWVLEDCWTEGEELPRMRAASLHLVNLEGVRCLAIVGRAGMSGGGQADLLGFIETVIPRRRRVAGLGGVAV